MARTNERTRYSFLIIIIGYLIINNWVEMEKRMEEIEKRKVMQQIQQEDLQKAKEEALRQKREVRFLFSLLLIFYFF